MNIVDTLSIVYRILGNLGQIKDLIAKLAPLIDAIRLVSPLLPEIQKIAESVLGKTTEVYDVNWLQTSLNKLGANPKLVVDGSLGAATTAAIKAFQQKIGLDVDGWAGVQTTAAIIKALG